MKNRALKTVTIIGMGMSVADLTQQHLDLIQAADVLVAGRRQLSFFSDLPAEQHAIGSDTDGLIRFVKDRAQTRAVVILASGDPLLFGIGTRLVAALGAEKVRIYPNISSVAAAFARIKQPWHDARIISLHGRRPAPKINILLAGVAKAAILTDAQRDPAWIAQQLMAAGNSGYRFYVFERLGLPDERFGAYPLAKAAEQSFLAPNLVVLLSETAKAATAATLFVGMPESAYAHQAGLITKPEVRAVTVAKLRLQPGQVLWDLGAGSGAVGIEASLHLGSGRIFAVEKDKNRIADIKNNCLRYGIENLSAIQADLPQGLATLPDPDRVFVGGGGKQVAQIVAAAGMRLKDGGRMAVNTVLLNSVTAVSDAFEKMNFETEMVQIQVNRSKDMPWGQRLEASNPVWIISGEKPCAPQT